MEYISAEEFLKQPKEVQAVFLDWWSKNKIISDIVTIKINKERWGVHILSDIDLVVFEIGKDLIPLLTEGQLRTFIEDKTKGIVKVIQWNPCVDDNRYGYTIYILAKNEYKVLRHIEYKKLGTDLLQAYWKVACEIAKEC